MQRAECNLERPMQDRDEGFGEFYAQQKNWDDGRFGVLTPREKGDITAAIRISRASLPPESRVLDIGFGNGGFLVYGRKRKWEMQGTEMNELLLQRARRNGFEVTHGDGLNRFADDTFDLVVADSVLEHVPCDKITPMLRSIRAVARDGAVFMARFPNGDSPFGRFVQHGDPTHITTLGSFKAAYYAREAGMEIIYLGGEPQPLRAGLKHFCYRLIANPIRWVLNLFLNLLFCPGNRKALCSVNLVLIARVTKTYD